MYLSKPYLISREQYDNYLHTHIGNVINAYEWMVEENILDGIFSADAIMAAAENCHAHDASKYDEPEYEAYRQYWNPMPTEEVGEKRGNPCGDRAKYNVGWLHHYHKNPHHWEYWNLLHEDDQGKVLSLEMPDKYIIEMLADWLSFSFTANDLSELGKWWDKKKSGIVLHSNVLAKVENVIQAINNKVLSGYRLNEAKETVLPKRLVDNQIGVINKIGKSIEKDLRSGKISFKKAKARFETEIEDLLNDVNITGEYIDSDFQDHYDTLAEIAQNIVNDWKLTYKEDVVRVNEGKIKDLDMKLSTYKELEEFLDGSSPQDSDYIAAVSEMKKLVEEIPDFAEWYKDKYGKQPKKLESKSDKVSYSELVDLAGKVSQESVHLEVRNYKTLDDKARAYIGKIRVRAAKGDDIAKSLVDEYEQIPKAGRGHQIDTKHWIQLVKDYLGE